MMSASLVTEMSKMKLWPGWMIEIFSIFAHSFTCNCNRKITYHDLMAVWQDCHFIFMYC